MIFFFGCIIVLFRVSEKEIDQRIVHDVCELDEKVQFIKRHLGVLSSFNPQEERQQAREFVLHYLKDDGVFLARLLSFNSSDLVVTEIINQLWTRYKTVNRLYATVHPQRPTSLINNENTSIPATNNNTNLHQHLPPPPPARQRPTRIPPLPLPDYINHQSLPKNDKSSTDTDV